MTLPIFVEIFTNRDVWYVNPSYPTAVRPCSLTLAPLPVTQVSVERLFAAMRLLLSNLRSRFKQDTVEALPVVQPEGGGEFHPALILGAHF